MARVADLLPQCTSGAVVGWLAAQEHRSGAVAAGLFSAIAAGFPRLEILTRVLARLVQVLAHGYPTRGFNTRPFRFVRDPVHRACAVPGRAARFRERGRTVALVQGGNSNA